MEACYVKTKFKLAAFLLFLFFNVAMNLFLAGDVFTVSASVPTGLNNAFSNNPSTPLGAVAVTGAGYDTTATFEKVISRIINTVLGLVGIIFLVLAISGGYTWMVAGGNEEKVSKAKTMIINAAIGIIVILSAYAISAFVLQTVGDLIFPASTPTTCDPNDFNC